MPFGALPCEGGILFRLWAPVAQRVDLVLPDIEQVLPLPASRDGWFEKKIPDIGAGCRYQYRIDGKQSVPDPASRYQPLDVHGPSEIVDPNDFEWTDEEWAGRPWHEAVIYELHVGTFTPEGSFAAAALELSRLAQLGITAIELMPVADFAGARNWGYDGVLPFAPDSRYGHPDDLKRLICTAHKLGLMVFMDVVYNHFGPEGNYIALYAPQFFGDLDTSWGKSLNYARTETGSAREFFIHNALYWLTEFNMDGLRFDAVHAIDDRGEPPFLVDMAKTIRERISAPRHVHLVLENDNNEARLLKRAAAAAASLYTAQWNDDFHHAMHVILTGETEGYYRDYADAPAEKLGRSLTQGFIEQGDWSPYRGRNRGEPSADLPPTAFVNFLQNHDQIGNRALGERLISLAPLLSLSVAATILLLAPAPPLLFMGEEIGARQPFLFFCDFKGDLGVAVREGRRREFARFRAFSDTGFADRIPDPNDPGSFERSKLRASSADSDLAALYRRLLELRHREIIPRLVGIRGANAGYHVRDGLLSAWWRMGDGSDLMLRVNLTTAAIQAEPMPGEWRVFYATDTGAAELLRPWSVVWALRGGIS